MKKNTGNIVSLISQRTGSPEDITEKVITAFGEVLNQAAAEDKATAVPDSGFITFIFSKPHVSVGKVRKIARAGEWHLTQMKPCAPGAVSLAEDQPVRYTVASRRHLMNELKSDKRSGEILGRFIRLSSMPQKLLAEDILEISPKTLYTYRNSDKGLPVRINEHILKLEELYIKGIELFGSVAQFNKWLRSESFGLGGIKPLEILNSITGIEIVIEELVRIEFGATA